MQLLLEGKKTLTIGTNALELNGADASGTIYEYCLANWGTDPAANKSSRSSCGPLASRKISSTCCAPSRYNC